ncbi:endothelial cell-specific molecule 1-like [Ostrea edulis]|uniref:endothelial cell-specific molecule 1-like n=1 Tax=Ostrea edulis TaxID=37623 RepID=UPI0024AF7C18|nr:endothelial cell-specific molecule 1-like [Ostrea edulis]
MDGRLVIQLMFTAALSGVNGVSSNIGYNDSESLKTCGFNTHFNESVHRCVECPLGSFGVNCKEECIRGYYGYLCRSSCSCEVSACDPVTGCQDHSNFGGNKSSKSPAQDNHTSPLRSTVMATASPLRNTFNATIKFGMGKMS